MRCSINLNHMHLRGWLAMCWLGNSKIQRNLHTFRCLGTCADIFTASVDQCNALFADLVLHTGDYPQIHGPIGVAKRTLKRLEWSVSPASFEHAVAKA